MIANNKNISSALGISYQAKNIEILQKDPIHVEDEKLSKAENDYEYARTNLYGIIEQGTEALSDMIDFAKQAQHPRAYEVVGTLINNLVEANQKLLNLSKQVKDIKKSESNTDSTGSSTTNNNLFVGSTAELHRLLKGE